MSDSEKARIVDCLSKTDGNSTIEFRSPFESLLTPRNNNHVLSRRLEIVPLHRNDVPGIAVYRIVENEEGPRNLFTYISSIEKCKIIESISRVDPAFRPQFISDAKSLINGRMSDPQRVVVFELLSNFNENERTQFVTQILNLTEDRSDFTIIEVINSIEADLRTQFISDVCRFFRPNMPLFQKALIVKSFSSIEPHLRPRFIDEARSIIAEMNNRHEVQIIELLSEIENDLRPQIISEARSINEIGIDIYNKIRIVKFLRKFEAELRPQIMTRLRMVLSKVPHERYTGLLDNLLAKSVPKNDWLVRVNTALAQIEIESVSSDYRRIERIVKSNLFPL